VNPLIIEVHYMPIPEPATATILRICAVAFLILRRFL
jgi:hypothetical protein